MKIASNLRAVQLRLWLKQVLQLVMHPHALRLVVTEASADDCGKFPFAKNITLIMRGISYYWNVHLETFDKLASIWQNQPHESIWVLLRYILCSACGIANYIM